MVALLHARAAWRHQDVETAERELNDALGLTDVPLDRARILALLGEVRGDEDGDKQMAKAKAALQVSGKPDEAAQVELTRARAARRRGDLVAALERARQAQADLRKLGVDAAPADLQVGLVRLARGELTQARAELAKAAAAQAPAIALVARGALLACTPAGPDWTEFDARLASWHDVAGDDVGGGADSAWPLEWAAKRAADAGAVDRAVALYELAAHRYTLAGDATGTDRMQKRVRQVTLDSAETVLRPRG
jgi:hypothetical protein